jgi:uncharacterized Zn finger protein (UPF0148 family)
MMQARAERAVREDRQTMARIRCPACRQAFGVEAAGGAVVQCPSCAARIRIPRAAGGEATADAGSKTQQLEAAKAGALIRCPRCRSILNSPSRTAVVTCPKCNIRIKPKLWDSSADSRKNTTSADSGVKMDCPKCGRPLAVSARDGAASCRNCGAKLRLRLEMESSSDSESGRQTAPTGSTIKSGRIRVTSIVTPSGKTKTVRARSPSASALNPMTESFLDKMDDLMRPASPDDSLLIASRQAAGGSADNLQPPAGGPATGGGSARTLAICAAILVLAAAGVGAGLVAGIIPWPDWLPRPDWVPSPR